MMLILREREVYLIDRDNNVFAAPQLHFPQRKNPNEHVYDTLLEGVSQYLKLRVVVGTERTKNSCAKSGLGNSLFLDKWVAQREKVVSCCSAKTVTVGRG